MEKIKPLKQSSNQIKEVQLIPTVSQNLDIPINSIPFAVKQFRGKIYLFIVCDTTETVTERVRIDINSHNMPTTFPLSAYYLGTFEFPHPKGGVAILHAFMSKKSHLITVPSNVVSIHELLRKVRA